jgi:hypothetical protein
MQLHGRNFYDAIFLKYCSIGCGIKNKILGSAG